MGTGADPVGIRGPDLHKNSVVVVFYGLGPKKIQLK